MAQALPPFKNGWVDYHDNGLNPPKGKTRFGLVIDLNDSKERWNINFGVVPLETLAGLADNPDLSPAEQSTVLRLLQLYLRYVETDRKVMIATSKRNQNAGKARYRLVNDYSVAALIDVTNPEYPEVALFWGDEIHPLDDFYVPCTPNHTIKGRADV